MNRREARRILEKGEYMSRSEAERLTHWAIKVEKPLLHLEHPKSATVAVIVNSPAGAGYMFAAVGKGQWPVGIQCDSLEDGLYYIERTLTDIEHMM